MAINNQLRTFLDEGGTVYACRFASGALYGFPENLLMEGVKPFHPLDVLDSALTAWRDKAFQLNTWTRLSAMLVLDREAAIAAWRRAEARVYPTVMVNADALRAVHRRGPRGRRGARATCAPRTTSSRPGTSAATSCARRSSRVRRRRCSR